MGLLHVECQSFSTPLCTIERKGFVYEEARKILVSLLLQARLSYNSFNIHGCSKEPTSRVYTDLKSHLLVICSAAMFNRPIVRTISILWQRCRTGGCIS